jgi:hypothetical protein
MVAFIAITTVLCDIHIVGGIETISISTSIGQNASEFEISYAVRMSGQQKLLGIKKKKEALFAWLLLFIGVIGRIKKTFHFSAEWWSK